MRSCFEGARGRRTDRGARILEAHKTTFAMRRNRAGLMIGGIAAFWWAIALSDTHDCVAFFVGGDALRHDGSGAEGRRASRLLPFRAQF